MNKESAPEKPKEKNGFERRTKILFVTLNPNLQGPIPKLARLLVAGMKDLGWQVTMSTWGRHSDHENRLQKISSRFVDVCNIMWKLVRIRPDLLYVDTTLDENALIRDFFLFFAVHWFPVKKVLKIHGSKTALLIEPRHKRYQSLARFIIKQSDAILLLSDKELQQWNDFETRGRYFRVDNLLVPKPQIRSESDPYRISKANTSPTLLFVGRLIKEKGIFELLEAMPDILGQVDCHLLIAGDGNEKEEVIRRIKSAKLEGSVCLLGYLDSEQLDQVFQQSSILVLPSYREGFPTVITEAMSFGLPIITTPVGGIPDHLRDGVNALFIRPKDPRAIANAMLYLLSHPKLCLEMHFANLEKVREFKQEKVTPRYVEILTELLES